MSVRVSERNEGKLQVLSMSRKLTEYTLNMCKSDKNFPKSQRWLLPKYISDECISAMISLARANSLPIGDENSERHRLQQEAYSHLDAMLTLIDISYNLYGIPSRKVQYWTQLVCNTETKLKGWVKSDRFRFKNNMG